MGDYDRTDLFADDVSYPHINGMLADQGAAIKRGSVLGRITANGKWTLSLSGASDGSQVPRGIMAYDLDDVNKDTMVGIYDQGSFVSEKLIYGTGHSASTVEAALRAASIPIRLKSVGAVKAV